MQNMRNMIFLALIVFLSISRSLAISRDCCKDIKEEAVTRADGSKLLCGPGNTLPANCCDAMENEVKKYIAAYKVICPEDFCPEPKALGMQSGKIPDNNITASSFYDARYQPWFGRLLSTGTNCSWAPHKNDQQNSWLQIDLGRKAIITGIATQGSCIGAGFVKSYSIRYSNDATVWTDYQEGDAKKIFSGNKDTKSVVKNQFKVPFVAQFVQIRPQTFQYSPTLRVELYGCRM